MTDKTYIRTLRVLFVLNALFLAWAILWKCGVPFIGASTQRVINLVPFRGNTSWEMQFNVLLFVPYGFLLYALPRKGKQIRALWCLLSVICTSVLLEIMQYILAAGTSDITDVLLNTLGGVVGIAACFLMAKLFGKHARTAVLVAGVLMTTFDVYVSASLFLFGVVHLGFMMLMM